jgi:hypothetical protein
MKTLQFVALLLTTVALMPAAAHLFALPNKINLSQHDYFVTQAVYNGWALFGVVLFGNLLALAALAFAQRGQTAPFVLVLISFVCQLATLAIFFVFVFRPIRQPPTGRPCRQVGKCCAGTGNTATRPAR